MTIDPKLIDVVLPYDTGYSDAVAAGDTEDVLRDVCGNAARDFPDSWWIEPRDWAEVAAENDRNGTWAMNYVDRFTNQHATHECSTHSLCVNFSVARNRARAASYAEGPKKDFRYDTSGVLGSVWLSPLSVYIEANPDKWGGSGVRQVLEIAVRRGILPDVVQPADYGFKHALHGTTGKGGLNQGTGRWTPLSKLPDGWRETAKLLRPLEIVFPQSYEQAVCILLRGYAVSVGRYGHAVPWCRYIASSKLHPYPDSYDIIRYDSERTARSAWRGSFSIISTTLPDDWSRPAAG